MLFKLSGNWTLDSNSADIYIKPLAGMKTEAGGTLSQSFGFMVLSVIIVSLYKAVANCAMWKFGCGVVLEEWDFFF